MDATQLLRAGCRASRAAPRVTAGAAHLSAKDAIFEAGVWTRWTARRAARGGNRPTLRVVLTWRGGTFRHFRARYAATHQDQPTSRSVLSLWRLAVADAGRAAGASRRRRAARRRRTRRTAPRATAAATAPPLLAAAARLGCRRTPLLRRACRGDAAAAGSERRGALGVRVRAAVEVQAEARARTA
jgi:hypothetical protein